MNGDLIQMKTTILSGALVASLCLLTACGGGSSGSNSTDGGNTDGGTTDGGTTDGGSEPTFDIELSDLEMDLDTGEALAVNHAIPISFTITGLSNDSSTVENIPVNFSFVEQDPENPDEPRVCSSNAINVEVTGNGEPQRVEDFVIWPVTECLILAEEGKNVLLEVEFYRGEEVIDGLVSATMPELELRTAGVDIDYKLDTESSVALLSLPDESITGLPILSVNSSFLYNGADPYYSDVTSEEIPEDLIINEPNIEEELTFGFDETTIEELGLLPGDATLSYSIIPASSPSESFPLLIGEEDDSTSESFTFSRIEPGVSDSVAHDLYLDESGLSALASGGEFADESDFTIRGCVTTTFSQDGNGDTQSNDCQDVEIVMEREVAEEVLVSVANFDSAKATRDEITFNKEFRRSAGSSRIGISSVMRTENSLSRSGAFSLSEGNVTLRGKLGRSFSLVLSEALVEAELSPERAFYDVQLRAFNEVVFSASDEEESNLLAEEDFSIEKSRTLGNLGFGFGPVRLGFTVSAGGRVALTVDDELALLIGEAQCQDVLGVDDVIPTCAQMTRAVTPTFSMTGKVFGGLNLFIVKAGVNANLRFVNTSFPLVNTLGFGLTDDARFLVRGDVNWDSNLQLISGKIKLVGTIKIFRFRRSKSVTVFSFSSKTKTFNLLNKSISTEELL